MKPEWNKTHAISILLKQSVTAYCEATLVNEEDGKDIITTNYVRYSDKYVKVDGKWYIKRRRTTFLISEKRELAR